MGTLIDITGIGQVYIPSDWESALTEATTTKRYDLADGIPLNAIAKELRLGRNVLVQGMWESILRLLANLEKRRSELIRPEAGGKRDRGRRSLAGKRLDPLARVMILVDLKEYNNKEPHLRIPHLVEFLGDNRHAPRGHAIAVPAIALRHLLVSLESRYPVRALNAELCAPNSVLQPRQQEVYNLLRERLITLRPSLPRGPICLDMGCGSGALALVMAQVLGGGDAAVWATDRLPEALATTRLNAARLESEGTIPPAVVRVTDGGDLYDPVGDKRFDIVVFNPPWANARPRTRQEIARYDWQQETARRFLGETPGRLAPDGHLLLFYADNAGTKAVQVIRDAWRAAGFQAVETLSRRIRVARRWEHIYLYDLVMADRVENTTL